MIPASRRPARPVIGWREWVALPDLGIDPIKAKVDTGAATSALHAFDLERFTEDARPMVRFKFHPLQRRDEPVILARAPLVDVRRIRSSDGRVSERPVIATLLRLAGRTFPVEITLTPRDDMGFRMLLGRQALRGRFRVDPARAFTAGRPPGMPDPRTPETS